MGQSPAVALAASLILVVASSLCQPAVHNKAIPLAVKTHVSASPALVKPDADTIANDAGAILQKADWNTDVKCAASFVIESFGSFDDGKDGVVYSQQDFDALFQTSGAAPANLPLGTRQVRVVSEIRWCGPLIVNAAGCADPVGFRIAVVRRGSDREGVLWAHEIGHTSELQHRPSLLAVMNGMINPDHKEVTAGECAAYRQ